MTKTEQLDKRISVLERRLEIAVVNKIKYTSKKKPERAVAGIKGAARDRIYEHIKAQDSNARDIARELNLNYHVVLERLRELKKRNLIEEAQEINHTKVWRVKENAVPSV